MTPYKSYAELRLVNDADEAGCTALDCAAYISTWCGLPPRSTSPRGRTVTSSCSDEVEINKTKQNGDTALIMASQNGHFLGGSLLLGGAACLQGQQYHATRVHGADGRVG
jgi:hypothetical protein